MEKTADNSSIMIKVATFVVDRRNLFFLLFVMAIVFSVISSGWVDVENSLAAYLPETTETKKGMDLMEEEFKTYGSAKVMATNINYSDALKISEEIKSRPDVSMVQFDEYLFALMKERYAEGRT